MENFYKILGINSSATAEEIRRAYRILARRYHPDVNPGKASEERFKLIARAYETLSDTEKRRNYDIELEQSHRSTHTSGFDAYQRAARVQQQRRNAAAEARKRAEAYAAQKEAQLKRPPSKAPPGKVDLGTATNFLKRAFTTLTSLGDEPTKPKPSGARRISVVEVSLSMRDAIEGIKKTIEINEPEGVRKVSVRIPPGSRSGSVVHLRATQGVGEDLVLIVRVAQHPTISLQPKGLVVEIPVSVREAIEGATITVPTLEEPILLKVPPGSQSGLELRVRDRGVASRDGARGDLFYRVMIRVPESKERAKIIAAARELDTQVGGDVRSGLPKSLLEVMG